jgi:hypothetical protein
VGWYVSSPYIVKHSRTARGVNGPYAPVVAVTASRHLCPLSEREGQGVHRSARGAADSLTITSSNHASMKAIGRGVALQFGTNCMASNNFTALLGEAVLGKRRGRGWNTGAEDGRADIRTNRIQILECSCNAQMVLSGLA